MTMKAVLFPGDRKVEVKEVPIPTPGSHEVLIRMKASAICRSDMSLYYGNQGVVGDAGKSGCVHPGHEPAGEIVEVGEGVTRFKTGDRVAVYLAIGCGECGHCRSGYKMFCKEWKCIGFDQHGGDADYMVVPAENCMRIPDGMSYVTAAVSTDAVGTLYHAQKRLAINGRDTLVIFGLGPMGGAGVMVAKGLGATVIAVDMLDERLEVAKELGADYTINAKTNVLEQIMEITKGRGADAGIDCSGSPIAQNTVLDSLRAHGRAAFIGEGKEVTIKPSEQLIRKQITLMGSWYFPIFEYDEITKFIMDKGLPVEKLVSHTFKLEEAETAFRMFDERKTEKAVFVWE
ncbi:MULTISPECIES: zinc-binding dehydrogenase [unclassified Paenibacillus]|uniref:zinc-dependent alcohol dehydrogenase family protein n=1 Tax=unclassified Paenibacillus TaxID=185978 RepID=UPI001AE5EBDA|nr:MULTISPECIES: zinc-binding dehydrogenase [unclassified Paenibacillus]MBP1157293.1 propanol-preferring alcohol dehydrogenase [Paenibacillus sp. PvP091]MBP1171968.1 propanol-preferring alcohol dehydrogenase [Paenibacillus sp. PvR098]MBP2438349.1 propanol-preferring alcohol dehydrogenase [Paenibacillus sp. PvP052]